MQPKPKTEENVMTTDEQVHVYQVRERRHLFFIDPSDPKADKAGNLWAAPGEYVEAIHPVLRQIVKSQRHKLRQLAVGEAIPKGSIFHTKISSASVAAMIQRFDRIEEKQAPVTDVEIVVGAGAAPVSGLSPDPGDSGPVVPAGGTESTKDDPEVTDGPEAVTGDTAALSGAVGHDDATDLPEPRDGPDEAPVDPADAILPEIASESDSD